MQDADDAAVQDNPLLTVIASVGFALDDCERVLAGAPGRPAAEAREFARFLQTEMPRLLEDWQLRQADDRPGEAAAGRPTEDRPEWIADPVTIRGHIAEIREVAFSPDGATVASADGDGIVRLWDVRTGQGTGTLSGAGSWATSVQSLAFSPDGTALAVAAMAGTLWDLTSGAVKATLATDTPSGRAWSVAYSPDGDLVATGGSDSVHLWDPRTGQEIRTLLHPVDPGSVVAVAFSSDGATLASGGLYTPQVLVWDTRTGQARHVLTGHSRTIRALAFSPDGQTLASASYDRTVRLWDVCTGRALATLTGHTNLVMAVAFHPGGTILASGGASESVDYPDDDNTVRLWDISTMRPIATLTAHTGTVSGVAFHPDGTYLASASYDLTVRLWPINLQPDPRH